MFLGTALLLYAACFACRLCFHDRPQSGTQPSGQGMKPQEMRRFIWASYLYWNLGATVSVFREVQLRPHTKPVEGRSVSKLPGAKVVKDASCLCCLEEFRPLSQVAVLPCGHVYHTDCIASWSMSGSTMASQCPACRQRFDF